MVTQEPSQTAPMVVTVFRAPILLCAAILTALLVLGVRETYRIVDDPETYFLRDEAGAEWIRADAPFFLGTRTSSQTVTVFECRFTTAAAVENARLTVRAFRRCQVELDNRAIDLARRASTLWLALGCCPVAAN